MGYFAAWNDYDIFLCAMLASEERAFSLSIFNFLAS